MKQNNDRRFEMRVSDTFLETIDTWRRIHPGIPPRSEAIRELASLGLEVAKYRDAAHKLVRVLECAEHDGALSLENRETLSQVRASLLAADSKD